MSKFIKSIGFPILLFLAIEILLLVIGIIFFPIYPTCEAIGGICETPSYGLEGGIALVVLGIIPSAIISIIVYFVIKKFSK